MEKNYLEQELYDLIKTDDQIFDFIQIGSLDGMWYWDLEQPEHEWMNSRFWKVLGYDPGEMKHLASEWQDIIFSDDLKLALENFEMHSINPDHPYDQVVRYKHKNGSTLWVRCRGIIIRNELGKPIRMLGAHTDITELKLLQQELEIKNAELNKRHTEILTLSKKLSYKASRDYLTDLYNRHMMDHFIQNEKKKSDRRLKPFSLFMIDVNCFKNINDDFGHVFGDEILKDLASKLEHRLRNQDIKSRWGGDEFLVVLPETTYQGALTVFDKLSSDMAKWCIKFMDQIVHYDVTVGISEYQIDEDTKLTLMRADADLYEKKEVLSSKKFCERR